MRIFVASLILVLLLGVVGCNDHSHSDQTIPPSAMDEAERAPTIKTRSRAEGKPLATTTASGLPLDDVLLNEQAERIRQALDRPFDPRKGQLGNLRHLQINASQCAVRIVSGTENRVYPGSKGVLLREQSRVLYKEDHVRPIPRDFDLYVADPCKNPKACASDQVSEVPQLDPNPTGVCFTLELASAHSLLLNGAGLDLVFLGVEQPRLRIANNGSSRLWFEEVAIGELEISGVGHYQVGGTGRVLMLNASAFPPSQLFLHDFDADWTGVSVTSPGAQFTVAIDADSKAGFYQPARAPGKLANAYGIEVLGPIAGLEVPAGQVKPSPIRAESIRQAASLKAQLMTPAMVIPQLPPSATTFKTPVALAAELPPTPRDHLAQVLQGMLPAPYRLRTVGLFVKGQAMLWIEGGAVAEDQKLVQLLDDSGAFTDVSYEGRRLDPTGHAKPAFGVNVHFACDQPGLVSQCAAADPNSPDAYTEAQLRALVESSLPAQVRLSQFTLKHPRIVIRLDGASPQNLELALDNVADQLAGMLFVSSHQGPGSETPTYLTASLKLICLRPPIANGVCSVPTHKL